MIAEVLDYWLVSLWVTVMLCCVFAPLFAEETRGME